MNFKNIFYFLKHKKISIAYTEFKKLNEYKNLSPATLQWYDETYSYFTEFCNEKMLCYKITENLIMDYVLYMQHKLTINDVTINTRLRALRAFVNFCVQKKYMPKIVVKFIKVKNAKNKIPYTDSEVDKLVTPPTTDPNNKNNFCEYRNWALLCYLLRNRKPITNC